MTIDEELALRLMKQRLPLRQRKLEVQAMIRDLKGELTKLCYKIRVLDLEIDSRLMDDDSK